MSNIIASTAPKARQLTHDEIHEIEHEKTHYPYSQAVGLEALKIVQKYQGWVSDESLLAVAEYLNIPADDLEGVATFFNLIYRRPVGKNVILFCDSVACWMLGCDSLKDHISQKLAQYPSRFPDRRRRLRHVHRVGHEVGEGQVVEEEATVGVKVGAHPPLLFRRQLGQCGNQRTGVSE